MNRIISIIAPVLLAATVLAESQAVAPSPHDMDSALAGATDRLIAGTPKAVSEGHQYRIAVVPFVDPGSKRLRRLGVVAAETVNRRLAQQHPAWLRPVERVALSALLEEQRTWVSTVVSRTGTVSAAETPSFPSADLLIVGTVVPVGDQIRAELRLVTVKTGTILGAAPAEFVLPPEQRGDFLAWVQRAADGSGEGGVTSVIQIDLTVAAQRPNTAGGLASEWTLKAGAALRRGDRFRIRFSVDADACVFAFLCGPDGKTRVLFPTSDWEAQYARRFGRPARPLDNYCRAEWAYDAPGPDMTGTARFYDLDQAVGENVLYVAACRGNLKSVEDVRLRLEQAPSHAERLALLRDKAGFDHVEAFTFRQE